MSEERKKENVLTDYWKTAYTKWFLPGFIDTYIHLYKDSFQEDFFRSLFEIYYKFIAHNELSIEVWVPIIFMQFDFNCFEIMDDTSIERMSTELQLSRNTRTSSNNTANSVVIGAATHAFRFKNIVVNNDNADTAYNHLNDISFYGGFRDKVNTLLASIRIVWPKCEVGYCQFVAVPVGWQRNFKADLIETFVASERGYPDYFEDYGWLEYGNQIMAESDAIKVKLINETLSTDSKRFSLAMKRLNRASLNSHEDDSIIETAIALESLLSSDSKGDISYRLATRATLLNKLSPFENYNSEQIFRLCKQLYKFRSSIVHGSFRVVKKTFTKNEQELPIVPLGLKFLKHVPRTLISNPQIRNPEDIDKLLF